MRSETSRDESPDTTPEELAELMDGNSGFAFDLYHTLRENSDSNLFCSPYSISVALAMTYAGARGETERQMADTLRFLLPQDRLHPAFNSLDLDLRSLTDLHQGEVEQGSQTVGISQGGFTLEFANAVWGQQDYMFLDTYLDMLARNYGAGVRPVDFKEQPEESRLIINEWVAEQTRDTIKDIIPPDAIKPDRTRLVLANAIYFKANWRHRFDESLTYVGQFHLVDGDAVDTPMMTMEESEWFMYASGDGYQALELPYGDQRISMAIILPDLGRFGEFESSLDAKVAGQILKDLERTDVDLTMPKFEFESDLDLGDILKAMGMPDAFGRESDFSGMDGQKCIARDDPCLFTSDVLHKSFVSVEEKGTEASAASVVVVERPVTRTARTPITVVVDRPFIFLIRDNQTGAMLFLGRVLDPRK